MHHNSYGTPLQISPCAPPNPIGSCNWRYAAFGVPDVNTVYFGTGLLPTLEADLGALQRWTFATPGLDEDINSVVTSLMIDEPSGEYATSGIQTSQMRDFDLAWETLPLSELQPAASLAGANGRVITALAFNAGSIVYLSYGWQRDRSTVYEVEVVHATVNTLAREATRLAGAGYIITALGGNYTDGFLLVGTRMRGVATPRPIEIATDSIRTQPYDAPEVQLAKRGYAIVGGILVERGGTSPTFNLYVGAK